MKKLYFLLFSLSISTTFFTQTYEEKCDSLDAYLRQFQLDFNAEEFCDIIDTTPNKKNDQKFLSGIMILRPFHIKQKVLIDL